MRQSLLAWWDGPEKAIPKCSLRLGLRDSLACRTGGLAGQRAKRGKRARSSRFCRLATRAHGRAPCTGDPHEREASIFFRLAPRARGRVDARFRIFAVDLFRSLVVALRAGGSRFALCPAHPPVLLDCWQSVFLSKFQQGLCEETI